MEGRLDVRGSGGSIICSVMGRMEKEKMLTMMTVGEGVDGNGRRVKRWVGVWCVFDRAVIRLGKVCFSIYLNPNKKSTCRQVSNQNTTNNGNTF